jgi:hypothetical protein
MKAQMKQFIVYVQHDTGILKFKVKAMQKAIALLIVERAENCPSSAILKVDQL